jgi:hypothetical protein
MRGSVVCGFQLFTLVSEGYAPPRPYSYSHVSSSSEEGYVLLIITKRIIRPKSTISF